MTATGRGQWERRGFTGRWAALGLLVASVCFVSLSIPNTSLPRSALLSYPGFPRSLRSALDVSTLPPLAEEAHAVGAGWAAGRGRGLVVRPFGGAALYLDVNGNPVTNHYGADPQAGGETPFWMGFRSHIDGYNVNQSPYTSPGGAQDHQEPHYPVYYSSGKPINPVAGNSAASDSMEAQAPKNPWEPGASNVFGAGGKIYQYPGRGGTR